MGPLKIGVLTKMVSVSLIKKTYPLLSECFEMGKVLAIGPKDLGEPDEIVLCESYKLGGKDYNIIKIIKYLDSPEFDTFELNSWDFLDNREGWVVYEDLTNRTKITMGDDY